MELKHTKGPWQGKDIEFFSRDIMGICATFNDDKTEAESNARLISCAPEMLECLINEAKNQIIRIPVTKNINEFVKNIGKTKIMQLSKKQPE